MMHAVIATVVFVFGMGVVDQHYAVPAANSVLDLTANASEQCTEVALVASPMARSQIAISEKDIVTSSMCILTLLFLDQQEIEMNKSKQVAVRSGIVSEEEEEASGFWMSWAWAFLQVAGSLAGIRDLVRVGKAEESDCDSDSDSIETVQASDADSEEDAQVPVAVLPRRVTKQVRFAESMQVREYAVTHGVHPLTRKFALSLDWTHAATELVPLRDNGHKDRCPRAFSQSERREILAIMAGKEPRRSPRLLAQKTQADFTAFFP